MQQKAPRGDHSQLLVNLWVVHVHQQLAELLQQPTRARMSAAGAAQDRLTRAERTVNVASFPPTSSNFREGTCSSSDFDFAETQFSRSMTS